MWPERETWTESSSESVNVFEWIVVHSQPFIMTLNHSLMWLINVCLEPMAYKVLDVSFRKGTNKINCNLVSHLLYYIQYIYNILYIHIRILFSRFDLQFQEGQMHKCDSILKWTAYYAVYTVNKTSTISDQFPQTDDNVIKTNTHSLTSFSPLSEMDVSKRFQSSHYLSTWSHPHSPPSGPFFFSHTCTYSHYQHLSSHRYISHGIWAGSGKPTAKITRSKSSTFRKLQTGIPSSIHCKDTWASCVQPIIFVSCTEQPSGQQTIWL